MPTSKVLSLAANQWVWLSTATGGYNWIFGLINAEGSTVTASPKKSIDYQRPAL